VVTSSTYLSLRLEAVPESVREARNAVARAAPRLGLRGRRLDDVRLCVSEAVANVVRHAYGSVTGDVAVVVGERGGELLVSVRDWGCGLRRTEIREGGGYGLRIIERVTKRVEVEADPAFGTEITMVFAGSGLGPGREPRLTSMTVPRTARSPRVSSRDLQRSRGLGALD
jgi:anti-sigma regulatory factor (Ser/Thr protein kinase)